jgi:Cof subfamily protein (haloacid dehalogenase superfamily)
MLFASDIDGTLLRTDESIGDLTLDAVAKAASQAYFVYATGRPHEWLEPVSALTGHHGIAICSNGAHVTDLATGADVVLAEMMPATMREAVAVVRRLEPAVTFAVRSRDLFGHTPDYVSAYAVPNGAKVAPIEQLIDEPRIKVLFRVPNRSDDLLDQLEAALRGIVSMTYGATPGVASSLSFIELLAPGVTKASALAVVAERLGVDQSDVVSFGDNRNDVEMLQWSGHGVAMANGSPLAIAAANEVTSSNDEDGVGRIIHRYLS